MIVKYGGQLVNKRKHSLSLIVYLISILSLIGLAVGFVLALQDQITPQAKPLLQTPKNSQASIKEGGMLVGLGDSLTKGVGDSKGLGYFGLVKEDLRAKATQPVSAVNLAVSGQTSSELAKQIQQTQVRSIVKEADWITLTIGGNDLFRSSGRLEKIDEQAAEKSRIIYEKNLTFILSEIRKLNPDARIYLFGLYNPFGDLAEEKRSSRLAAEWNETMHKVSSQYEQVVVVPTFDLFQLQPNAYLYSDHFHPNEQGYSRMAARLLQVIYDTPQGGNPS